MINKDKEICRSFVELAENILPKSQIDKFINEKDRQYRSSTYFEHKRLYEASVRKR